MRKSRREYVAQLAQGHKVSKWQNPDLDSLALGRSSDLLKCGKKKY